LILFFFKFISQLKNSSVAPNLGFVIIIDEVENRSFGELPDGATHMFSEIVFFLCTSVFLVFFKIELGRANPVALKRIANY
jgi:hypothetical protein